MTRTTKWIVSGAVAAMIVVAGAGIVLGGGGSESDKDTPLTGTALEQAQAAALKETGGGTVVDSEIGDGGAAYSVEIQLADGSVVEVSLDESFNVIGTENDDDGAGDSGQDD